MAQKNIGIYPDRLEEMVMEILTSANLYQVAFLARVLARRMSFLEFGRW